MTSLGKLWFVVLAIASMVSISSISRAQAGSSFYVAKTGKDTNSGSFTAPWLTIQHAATSLTCSAGYCNGASIYGSTDYAGNPRINGSGQINIGAYEQ